MSLKWARLGWREGFFWRRLGLGLLLALGPAAICFVYGWGLVGLLLFVVGAWPWPIRVSVSDGVSLRWLFLKEWWPAESIARVSVEQDLRRWAWRRRKRLVVERWNRAVPGSSRAALTAVVVETG